MSADFTKALRDFLIADTAVNAIVGTKIAMPLQPQGQSYPYIVFGRITSPSQDNTLDSPDPVVYQDYRIDCYAYKSYDANNLAWAVNDALEGLFSGTMGGFRIFNIDVGDIDNLTDLENAGSETLVYRFSLNAEIKRSVKKIISY